MKKVLSVLMAALMAVSLCALAACGGDADKDPVKYTVTYDANGGTGTPPAVESYEEGATVTVKPATTFTRDGFAFTTWNDGTSDIAAGATFEMPAKNVTLKAQWEVQPQLYGVWTCDVEIGRANQPGTVTYELTITEDTGDTGVLVTMVATMKSGETNPSVKPLQMGDCAVAVEDANTPGTYDFEGVKLIWSETDKTLTFVTPSQAGGDRYPMKYQPLPENVNIDGDYWMQEGEGTATYTLHISGKAATLSGGMAGEFTLIYTGAYAVAMAEGTAQYILVKTEDGILALTGAGDADMFEFKKGTPPASGTAAE